VVGPVVVAAHIMVCGMVVAAHIMVGMVRHLMAAAVMAVHVAARHIMSSHVMTAARPVHIVCDVGGWFVFIHFFHFFLQL
jgi:hypothetical protein